MRYRSASIRLACLFSITALFGPMAPGDTPHGSLPAPPTILNAESGSEPTDEDPFVPRGPGWPLTIDDVRGSPVLADLDNDGIRELLVGAGTRVLVFNADATFRWFKAAGAPSEIAVGNVVGVATPEIATNGFTQGPFQARIFLLDTDGNDIPGWPVPVAFHQLLVTSNPVIVDLDGDGDNEVGAASDAGVSFFNADGAPVPGWPYLWGDSTVATQFSALAAADLDGDGQVEVVVGNAADNPGVHAIASDGTALPGWPIHTGFKINASPALADLDFDGDLEIVVAEGDFNNAGDRVWVWNHDGTPFPGWPVSVYDDFDGSRSAPAIADVNGDGQREIVIHDSNGMLHVLDSSGSELPGFPFAYGGFGLTSPAVIDVDDDGQQEIFLHYGVGAGEQVVSGWNPDGSVLPGFPKTIIEGSELAPVGGVHVADVDLDGDLELAVIGNEFFAAQLWILPVDDSVYFPLITREDWPKRRKDVANTGCLCELGEPPDGTPALDIRGAVVLVLIMMSLGAYGLRRRRHSSR